MRIALGGGGPVAHNPLSCSGRESVETLISELGLGPGQACFP